MELDDYLRGEHDHGELDSQGAFTVDAAKAREKLAGFQLADPYSYILKLVQWAVASQPSYVDVRLRGPELTLEHDGDVPAPSELDAEMLLGRTRALTHLVFGVAGAQRFQPTAVELTVRDESGARCLRLGESWREAGGGPAQHRVSLLRLAGLRRPFWPSPMLASWVSSIGYSEFEPDAPMTFLRDIWTTVLRPESGLVCTRCVYAPLPIFLNGQCVNRPYFGMAARWKRQDRGVNIDPGSGYSDERKQRYLLADQYSSDLVVAPAVPTTGHSEWHRHGRSVNVRMPDAAAAPNLSFKSSPMLACSAVIGGIPTGPIPAQAIYFIKDGVLIACGQPRWGGTVRAIVSARSLTTDLSQFALVKDAAYQKLDELLHLEVMSMR